MARWSLANRLLDINFDQFLSLSRQFNTACADQWVQNCEMDVRLMDRLQHYTTFYDEDALRFLQAETDRHTTALEPHHAEITEAQFKAARHIVVTVRPQSPDLAPLSAFGQIEFKGNFNRRATFYIQGGDDNIARAAMFAANPRMRRFDGFEAHGING